MADVVIIGAGPAGLAVATYLAQAGVDHVVLERAHHPRPHVGESLMPAAIPVLREMGALPILDEAGFPRSGGVCYYPVDGERRIDAHYAEFPSDEIGQDYTYHADRAKLDVLLLKCAETQGARIIEGVEVEDVLLDGDRAVGVRANVAGMAQDIPARIVVDAGGRRTFLGRRFGLRRDEDALHQFALHAWFAGVRPPPPGVETYTHVYLLPAPRAWAWRAPLGGDVTSVGVVGDRAAYRSFGARPADFFRAYAGSNPALAEALKGAEALNELKGEISYAYRLARVCGHGWLAVGDAARFLDPVFGSGVSAALNGGRRAARTVIAALERGSVDRDDLLPYEERTFAAAEIFDDLVRLYYKLLPVFTAFLRSPEFRPGLLRLLQGDVYDRADARVLEEMRVVVREVEADPHHPLREALTDVPLG